MDHVVTARDAGRSPSAQRARVRLGVSIDALLTWPDAASLPKPQGLVPSAAHCHQGGHLLRSVDAVRTGLIGMTMGGSTTRSRSRCSSP